MVGAELVERWVRRLRADVPGTVAVLLGGSYVRGDAGSSSDVDFDVLVADGPRDEWPTWFDIDGERLVRIDAWIGFPFCSAFSTSTRSRASSAVALTTN